jgi:uncharacterized membrane protein YeiH
MNIVQRAKSPTPKFFRVLRSIGLALLAISGTVIAAPVALPVAVITIAGYVAVAGGVLSAVSQMTVDPLPPNPLKGEQNAGVAYETEIQNKPRDGD